MKLDYSKFKKVSDDDKCTVLKHPRGHEIRIAKDGLDPQHKEELSKLKSYKDEENSDKVTSEPKKMASGGWSSDWKFCPKCGKEHPNCKCYGVEGTPMAQGGEAKSKDQPVNLETSPPPVAMADGGDSTGLTPAQAQQPGIVSLFHKMVDSLGRATSGVQQNTNVPPTAAQQVSQPQGDQGIMSTAGPQGQAATDQTTTPAPTDATPPPDAGDQSVVPAAQDTQPMNGALPSTPKVPDDFSSFLTKHNTQDKAWQNDLMSGNIQPKTYSQLMGNGVLGRIGSMFGLLAAGMGSGLTHQPNSVLQMWDKTIATDLEAQKQSKANAQNMYRLTEAHRMNTAQIAQQAHQMGLTDQQAKGLQISNDQANTAIAWTRQNRAQFANLADKYRMMPEGPAKQRMAQVLTLLNQHIEEKNMQLNSLAAGVDAQINYLQKGPATDQGQATQQNQPEANNDIKSVLAPDAQARFNALAQDPLAKPEYEQIRSQFTAAQQADKALSNLKPTFDTMRKNDTGLGAESRRWEAPGLPYNIGHIIPAVGGTLNKQFNYNKESKYESAKTGLSTELANAMKDTPLGVEGTRTLIEANSPSKLNSDEATQAKMRNVEGAVKRALPTALLEKYHLLNKKTK